MKKPIKENKHLLCRSDHKKETKKRGQSIKFKLIISYVLLAAIPLIIVNSISTTSFRSNLRSTSMQLTTQMVRQTRVNINYFTSDIEKNVNKFIMNDLNSTVGDNLVNLYSSSKDMDQKKYSVKLKQELDRISIFESNIEAAAIKTDIEIIGGGSSISDETINKLAQMDIPTEGLWYTETERNNEVYYIRSIKNSITGGKFGVLVNKIKLDTLDEEISQIDLFKEAVITIVDSDKNVLCGNLDTTTSDEVASFIGEKEEVKSSILSGNMVAYATGDNGWQIVVQMPMRSLTSSIEHVRRLVWVLVAIIGIAAVFVGYVVSKSVIVSITELVKAMKKTEKGDLTVSVRVRGNDEMASLCVSFNNMIANIRHLISQAHTVIKSSMDSGNILNTSTEQSVEAFTQLAASIDEITKGSTSQAEDAQNSSTVMNNLSESIQKVRHNTQNLFESTEDAKSMISDATSSMEQLNTTMASSIKVSEQVKVSIIELGAMTQNIGQIMSFVDGISEQTNLLALNASIEAARAGEVGKGFAVVANEVRNLSEQSKASTSNVRDTLGEIEKKSTSTVDLVTKANRIFSQQEEAVTKTYEVFKEIIQRLLDMDKELEYINAQVIDMQKLKDTMSNKIERITTVTQENAAATEEVNALSEEQKEVMEKLSHMSVELINAMTELDATVEQFKI